MSTAPATMVVIDEPTPQRRGRPRSPGADQAILTATIELAAEVGITKMSMDDLAARAGVSKATVYRRWPNKEALVLEALQSAMHPFDTVDTGSLRSDLDPYLGEVANRFGQGQMSDVLPHLIEAGCHDPAIRNALDDYIQLRRRPLRTILERGLHRGELPGDTDVDVLIDALIGPFVYRRLLTHEPIDRAFIDRLLALVLPSAPVR